MIELVRIVLIGLLAILRREEPGLQEFTGCERTADCSGSRPEVSRILIDRRRANDVLVVDGFYVSLRKRPLGLCQARL